MEDVEAEFIAPKEKDGFSEEDVDVPEDVLLAPKEKEGLSDVEVGADVEVDAPPKLKEVETGGEDAPNEDVNVEEEIGAATGSSSAQLEWSKSSRLFPQMEQSPEEASGAAEIDVDVDVDVVAAGVEEDVPNENEGFSVALDSPKEKDGFVVDAVEDAVVPKENEGFVDDDVSDDAAPKENEGFSVVVELPESNENAGALEVVRGG